jgi:hypothetical protein
MAYIGGLIQTPGSQGAGKGTLKVAKVELRLGSLPSQWGFLSWSFQALCCLDVLGTVCACSGTASTLALWDLFLGNFPAFRSGKTSYK